MYSRGYLFFCIDHVKYIFVRIFYFLLKIIYVVVVAENLEKKEIVLSRRAVRMIMRYILYAYLRWIFLYRFTSGFIWLLDALINDSGFV